MFFRPRSILTCVGIGFVLTLALVDGCDVGADDEGNLVSPEGNSSLAEARAFEGFPIYYAGAETQRLPLEAVQRTDRTTPARFTEFAFLYGSCRAAGDSGCGLPLTILLWPACYRYEQRYSIPARERVTVRGVPGRLFQHSRRLELYPAGATIVINGHGLESRAALLAVARALRGVNTPLPAASPFPARPAHAGRTLRCR